MWRLRRGTGYHSVLPIFDCENCVSKTEASQPTIHLPAALLLTYPLRSCQGSESSPSSDERCPISGLDQTAPLQHVDDVCPSDSGQPVGYDEYGHAPVKLFYGAPDAPFVL